MVRGCSGDVAEGLFMRGREELLPRASLWSTSAKAKVDSEDGILAIADGEAPSPIQKPGNQPDDCKLLTELPHTHSPCRSVIINRSPWRTEISVFFDAVYGAFMVTILSPYKAVDVLGNQPLWVEVFEGPWSSP